MQPRKEQGARSRVTRVTDTPPGAQRNEGTCDASSGSGLLDYEAAARYLCTTARHVRELWARRELAAIKVGRSVRFTKADLDAFIEARRVRAVR
ncbi:MAG: helix-turn-helix domain-containing protein [Actinomycetota bacterium]|nr:helix-turn-helix domain-containing protein [Actinomycetota bacterium]